MLGQSFHNDHGGLVWGAAASACVLGAACGGAEIWKYSSCFSSAFGISVLLGFLQQRENSLHQEGGFVLPNLVLNFSEFTSLDLYWSGFCSTCYFFFLGVAAAGIENTRQNTEAVNLVRHIRDGGTLVRETVLKQRPWNTYS